MNFINEILSDLQECYKISIQKNYEDIQMPLLDLLVKVKNRFSNEELKNTDYKDSKDRTKYILVKKLNNTVIDNLPKRRVPKETFIYLLENKLLDKNYFQFFSKNNFRTYFARTSGDLLTADMIKDYPLEYISKRYIKFDIAGIHYAVCDQWDKPSINKFIQYINNEFSKYIEIKEMK
jgi:hypothetical protein